MPSFSTKRRVRHSASDMFDLVADVEEYPAFVPLCQSLRLKSRTDKGEGISVIVAAMTVAYKVIHQTFTSRVSLDRPNLTITVEYLDGPFSRLQNRWRFHADGDSQCTVEFHIEYEFRSRTLAILMGAMFDTAFRKFSAAFEKRADEIYGRDRA